MSSDQGRSKHLRRLVAIFHRRKAGPYDFGGWLSEVCAKDKWTQVVCRHAVPDGKHREIPLSQVTNTFPCVCRRLGTPDAGKGCKFVVHDLRVSARSYLDRIGKGTIVSGGYDRSQGAPPGVACMEEAGEDKELEVEDGSESSNLGSSQELSGDKSDRHSKAPGNFGSFGEEYYGASQSTATVVKGSKPPRTGIRSYVIAYLWHQYKVAPVAMVNALTQLCDPKNVLCHLCGCGLCVGSQKRGLTGGCCDPSHLLLADQDLNNAHTRLHFALEGMDREGYRQMVRLIQQHPSGEGLF